MLPPRQSEIKPQLDEISQLQPSELAIQKLSTLLGTWKGEWPMIELISCYQEIWKDLPEATKEESNGSLTQEIQNLHSLVKSKCPSLLGLLNAKSNEPAFIDSTSERTLTHANVSEFVKGFSLPVQVRINGKPRVAVVMPYGPTYSLACVAVSSYYTLVPLASHIGSAQTKSDIRNSHTTTVLVLPEDAVRLQLDPSWERETGVTVITVRIRDDMTFEFVQQNPLTSTNRPTIKAIENDADDVAMVLFTSGTSGSKKLVPITAHNLLASIAFTAKALELTESDCCLNMMPSNHIGGLVRNIFAPLLSAGSTICCPSFTPDAFWDVMERKNPTWYYATPTMHERILGELEHRQMVLPTRRIRFICNGGADLGLQLARRLRNAFKCVVLPSYGMTECLPISTPPSRYCLEFPGTSGVPTGPEVGILSVEKPQARLGPGVTGKICVRGLPVFPGYLTKAGLDREGFNNAGWFDTGDMGYLDHNGCLFITGRSKEVINRGGEIISPSEVEEAILTAAKERDSSIYGKVTSVLAFSVPHKSLQEVVGAVIVSTPGEPRVDLRQLHHALRQRLDQPKWPVFLVYMDHLPMSHTKALRSNLSHRLHFESLSDNTPIADRHYEATAPAVGVAITTAIENRQCDIDPEILRTYITQYSGSSQVFIRKKFTDGLLQAFIFDVSTNTPTVEGILSHLCANLPGYLVPTSIRLLNGPIPIDATGSVNKEAINEAIMKPGADEAKDSIYIRVCDIFARILSLSLDEVGKSTDFFLAGGDSLQSGRMAFELRKEFGIRLPSDVLFINSTVEAMVAIVEKAVITQNTTKSQPSQPPLPSCNETYSSTHPIVLLAQLLPIAVFYPLKVAFHWTLFVYLLGEASGHVHTRPNVVTRTAMMTLAWAFAHLATHFVFPLLGIFFKLTVIGRYREGTYPMWGPYHTRWWLVQKALSTWGMGVFDKSSWSRRLYLQCMGMKIGRNVSIHPGAQLGEYDLLEIGDNVVLDNCVCRPFTVAHNTSIYLGRIQIGRDCSVGLRSIVAPGTHIPPRTYIGPRSSSWAKADATEENDKLMSARSPHPHWIWNFLIVKPLGTLCTLSMHLPWIAGLVPLANRLTILESGDKVPNVTSWLIESSHTSLFLRAQVYATIGGPVVKFMFILGIKKTLDLLCGRSVPGPVEIQSRRQILRTAVLSQILPDGHLLWFTELLGVHYELVSVALRALGARIGKRVYWPALGPFTQDYDLIEIGDDVLWGAQSHLNTSDGYGKDKVVIQDGAMVADRAIISPGVSVGERVQVGSGAFLKRNKHYSADSVLIGCRQGEAVQFPSPVVKRKNADGVSELLSTPFGRAFYMGLANYRVWTESEIICYTITIMAVVSVYWSSGPAISLSILLRIIPVIREHLIDASTTAGWQFVIISSSLAGLMGLVGGLQSFIAMVVVICSKWMLLGQRQTGPHPWDKDSFFQRQQLQLVIEKIMGKAYDGAGILGFLTGTEYLNIFFRALGARIGRNCALFANGRPTIMLTEPDLVTMGDRVAVDDASVVAHINTRGEFELRELNIGSGCVLRTASRLMSGASMGDNACLLEHTCILPGDHVDNGAIYQGWPAVPFEAVHDTPSS